MDVRRPRTAVPRAIAWVTSWVAAVTFLVIFVVNVAQIVLRSLGSGWVWVGDLSQLLFIWTIMMGATAAFCLREHIVASFLIERLSGRLKLAAALFIRAIEVAFFGILLIAGASVADVRGRIDYIQLHVSTAWAFYAIPVAAGLMLLAALTLDLRSEDEQPHAAIEEAEAR